MSTPPSSQRLCTPPAPQPEVLGLRVSWMACRALHSDHALDRLPSTPQRPRSLGTRSKGAQKGPRRSTPDLEVQCTWAASGHQSPREPLQKPALSSGYIRRPTARERHRSTGRSGNLQPSRLSRNRAHDLGPHQKPADPPARWGRPS